MVAVLKDDSHGLQPDPSIRDCIPTQDEREVVCSAASGLPGLAHREPFV
ncbi:hypothetical protein RGU70_07985 [Herbaspirillum sp. RTI4]|nr:hypothetical protein [Herbaspirillum sp. RTI4]MDY7578258.1 hypothetical protein [Herbaspirillum sp. RTI4]MEA9981249.1 hypothetical protein [Herbaspirillum sp. RTI4]